MSKAQDVSVDNSNNVALGADAVFTGTAEDCSRYASISVFIFADVSGTARIEFSSDQTNWDKARDIELNPTFSSTIDIVERVISRWFRIIYTNGSVSQSGFRLQTMLHKFKNASPVSTASENINPDDDLSLVRLANDFNDDISLGKVNGQALFAVVSNSVVVGTTFEDIWSGGGNLVYPTANETWEVVSSDANDTAAGSGAREVTIVSMEDDYIEKVTTVALNGTTPVTVSGVHFRVNSFFVSDVGGYRVANLGTITLRVVSAGATRSVIQADSVGSFSSHHTIPLGKTALWVQGTILAPKGEDLRTRSMFKLGGVGPFLIGGTATNYQSSLVYPFQTNLVLTEKSEILFQCKSTNINTFVTAVMEFKLIDN